MKRIYPKSRPITLSLNIALAAAIPLAAQAQQLIVTDGSAQTASGNYNTGNTPGASNGFALAAANGSTITGTSVTGQTGGLAAHAALVDLHGRIQLTDSTLRTTGDNAYGALAQQQGIIDLSNTAISVNGNNAIGATALLGGAITLNGGRVRATSGSGLSADGVGSSITAMGTSITIDAARGGSYGVNAQNGSSISLGGGTSITVNGAEVGSGHALRSSGVGSEIYADGITVNALWQAYGAVAVDGGLVDLRNGTNISSNYGFGLAATGAGSVITGSNLVVTSARNSALVALDGSRINLSDITLSHNSSDAGIYADNARIDLTNFDLKSQGYAAVVANNGANINLSQGTISDKIYGGIGLVSQGSGSQISADSVSLSIAGETAAGTGIAALDGGYVLLKGGAAVRLNSASSLDVTLLSSGAGSVVDVQNTTAIAGQENSVIGPWGAVAEKGGRINFSAGSSMTTYGTHTALYADGPDSLITSEDTSLRTSMGLSFDRVPGSVVATNGGHIELGKDTVLTEVSTDIYDYVVNASGEGSHVGATGATLNVDGDGVKRGGVWVHDKADAVLANGTQLSVNTVGLRIDANSTLMMQDASVKAAQVESAVITDKSSISPTGALVYGSLLMNDSSIDAGNYGSALQFGAKGDGVATSPAYATLSGGRLSSLGDAALVSYMSPLNGEAAAVLTLRDGAQLSGKNGELVHVANWLNRTSALKVVADNVSLEGNMRADWGNIYPGYNSLLDVELTNASTLKGVIENARDVSLDATSTLTLTGNSNVRRSLSNAGKIAFLEPVTNDYKTLTVHGDLVGSGGTVVLNTQLNEGGPLANQYTDRVLVEGNASGTTYLAVTGSGTGAPTDTNRNGVLEPDEGISLAQVAGQSGASAFQLAGGYVAVGPWRYELHDYQPGSADAAQRVVAGSGNGYWDYRLQNAYVADPDPDPTLTPDPDQPTDPTGPANPADPATPSGPTGPSGGQRPAVVPQVPSYLTASTAMLAYGLRSLGTLHDRLGEIHNDAARTDSQSAEFYARVFGGDYRYVSNRGFARYGYNFDQNDRAVQIGGTWLKATGDASTWRLGAYGVTGNSRITPRAADGGSRMRMTGNSLGLTGTYEHASGLYIDGVVARNFYRTSVDTAERGRNMAQFRTRGWSYSLETGVPFVFGNGLRLEPQAQVVYQSLHTATFTDRDGLAVSPESSNAWTGRVGAYLSKTFTTDAGGRWTPWARLNYVSSGASGDDVNLRSDAWGVNDTLVSGKWGSVVQLGAGITGAWSNAWSVYGGADYQAKVGSAGERGWSANLGLRWRF